MAELQTAYAVSKKGAGSEALHGKPGKGNNSKSNCERDTNQIELGENLDV